MNSKKTALIIIVAIIGMGLVAYMLYNKPHRSVEEESAIEITASDLMQVYQRNEESANGLYLDKVLEVSGIVADTTTNQNGKQIVLLETNDAMFGISCTMKNKLTNISPNQPITIKGFCKGYLSDVVLTECVVSINK